jgi:anti-sigma regulatory factor (Ser/Thr protein kinase)
MPIEVQQQLLHGPMAPAAARHAVDDVLSGRVDEQTLGELRLVVSELVTNAVRHGRSRDGAFGFKVAIYDQRIRVEVSDAGAGFTPPGREPEPGELGGWGLVLVDRVAERWGVEHSPGTRVWAEVQLESDRTSGGGGGAAQAFLTV